MQNNLGPGDVIDNKFYNYITTFQKNNIVIKLSYDFIKFSIYINSTSDLTNLLNLLSFLSYSKKCYYSRYSNNTTAANEYEIEYKSKHYKVELRGNNNPYTAPYKPDYRLTIHDPDIEILMLLDRYLQKLPRHHIAEVEFTFDFIGEDTNQIKDFLNQHLYLKYQGKGFTNNYSTTRYFGNPRKSNKGGRSYPKEIKDFGDAVRFEVVYKRKLLKTKNYKINHIKDLINSDIDIVLRNIDFRFMHYERAVKRLVKEGLSYTEIKTIINNTRTIELNKGCRDANEYALEYLSVKHTLLDRHPFYRIFHYNLAYRSFLFDKGAVIPASSFQ